MLTLVNGRASLRRSWGDCPAGAPSALGYLLHLLNDKKDTGGDCASFSRLRCEYIGLEWSIIVRRASPRISG